MSNQDYWNNQGPQDQQYGYGSHGGGQGYQNWQSHGGPVQGYGDQSYNQGYDQNRPYDYNSPPNQEYQHQYGQNTGYQGSHDQYNQPPDYQGSHNQYRQDQGQHFSPPPDHNRQEPDYYSQNPGYDYNTQRDHRAYSPNPPVPQYDSTPHDNFQPQHQQGYYPPQPGTGIDPQDPNSQDRGLMGALAGGAVGAYGGHKVNHGFLGTIGGAIAGSLAEDALKKKKKDKKNKKDKTNRPPGSRRDSSSSSSSSSSDDEKKKKKKHNMAVPAAAGAGAYGMHQYQQHQQSRGPVQMRGNFSSSAHTISLDRDYDLIAACANVRGEHKLSSLSLNSCLSNQHGRFVWGRGGNFGASARNVRLIENGKVLEAELGTGGGGWNKDHIRLDERVSNNDGELIFLD